VPAFGSAVSTALHTTQCPAIFAAVDAAEFCPQRAAFGSAELPAVLSSIVAAEREAFRSTERAAVISPDHAT